MKKEIKRVGTSIGIIFNKEEAKLFDLKVGDYINLDDKILEKRIKGKRENVKS